jgi:DNA-binding MarR family transcriptional regulator
MEFMNDTSLVDCILELKRKCNFETGIADAFGITSSELHCLVKFDSRGTLAAHELCGRTGLSKSRGSRVIGSLGEKGLVSIGTDSTDKRYQLLSLSAKGRDCVKRIAREKAKCEEMLLAALKPAGYEAAKNSILALIDAI